MRFMKSSNNPRLFLVLMITAYLIKLALFASPFLLTIADLQAETNAWRKAGPEVSHVSAIAISRSSHNILYVGTAYGGVQKSLDGGQSWVSTSQTAQNVMAVVVDPDDSDLVFAGAFNGGIFKSNDGGDSWQIANIGLDCPVLNLNTLALDGSDSDILYAGTTCGVFKTSDKAGSWHLLEPLRNQEIWGLAIAPSDSKSLYAETSAGVVYRSTNGGTNWTQAKSSLTSISRNALIVDPVNRTIIYAGTDGKGVFKSTDGGDNWNQLTDGLSNRNVRTLAVDFSVPNTIYAGTPAGVFKSTDGGANWVLQSQGLDEQGCTVLAIDPVDPHTVYAAVSQGMAKSSNGAADWSRINSGLVDLIVSALAMPPTTPGTLYAATRGDCLFSSPNGGAAWSSSCSGLDNPDLYTLVFDPLDPHNVYAGTAGNGVNKSTDKGAHWSSSNMGLTDLYIRALAVDPLNPKNVYAGGHAQGVFKSTDGGASWTAASTGLSNRQVNALTIDSTNPDILYAGTSRGVFKSVDGGINWNESSAGIGTSAVRSLVIGASDHPTIYAGTFGVFRSDDGGKSWTEFDDGLTGNVSALTVDPTYSHIIYAGTEDGFFRSVNRGNNWARWNPGIEHLEVTALVINPFDLSNLYAGTDGRGVFSIMLKPSISVTSPNGGENWLTGSSQNISWRTEGPIGNVRIEFSIDGGTTYSTLEKSVSNTGSYSWAMPSTLSSRCLIKISEVGGDTSDQSDRPFSIVGCNFSISQTSQVFDSSGGTGSVTVNASVGCSWTASSNVAWVTVSSGTSGNGNGMVYFSVSSNSSTNLRTGILTVAGQTFTITQAGSPAGCSFTIAPTRQSIGTDGGSNAVTVTASSTGCSWVAISNVPWITVNSGTFGSGNGSVGYTVAANSDAASRTGTVSLAGQMLTVSQSGTATGAEAALFVPVVLSAAGLNNSFYTSELTLTNRGPSDAVVNFDYIGAFGGGGGNAVTSLPAGQQRIVPDAISYLKSLGVPIPESGNRGGTLLVTFSEISSPSDAAVTVRTTTAVGNGRAGLAYPGITKSGALSGPAYLCGLRQNATDRSNVAFQNLGSSSDGTITLEVTVYSGDSSFSLPLPDITLSPGGFYQISEVLSSPGLSLLGLSLQNGYVRVARKSGTAPYFAYGVVNDQANSDGSFVPPQLEESGPVT
ncbi:MAG TPA: YCF48-related protein, partial [Terriglobia bacterium]|nr:YCF48-related protein [Terriglobia bacterium]